MDPGVIIVMSTSKAALPHGGVLVGGQQAVAGLHAGHRHRPLARLAGHKHWLLVRLLWHGHLLWGGGTSIKEAVRAKERPGFSSTGGRICICSSHFRVICMY